MAHFEGKHSLASFVKHDLNTLFNTVEFALDAWIGIAKFYLIYYSKFDKG